MSDPKHGGGPKTILGWNPSAPQQGQPGWPQQPQGQSPHDYQEPSPPYALQPYAQPPPPEQPPYNQQPPYPQPYNQQPPYPQQYAQQPPYPQQYAPYPQQYAQQPPYPQQYAQQPPGQQPYGEAAYPQTGHAAAAAASVPVDRHDLRSTVDATVGQSERMRFIRLTYVHLMGAIVVFAGLLYLLMTNAFLIEKVSAPLAMFALKGRWNWAVVLAVFMVVSWVADYWASHTSSRAMQYIGLGIYVVAEALIFVPLLVIVAFKTQAILARGGGDPNILRDAAFTTLGIFGALTASVFITRKDFSFLRSGLVVASGAALMLIVLSLAFGFNLGIVFSIAMVLLCAGYILYQTSQVLAHYDPRNYVAAALALFSSVALMFWYVIRIFMRMRE